MAPVRRLALCLQAVALAQAAGLRSQAVARQLPVTYASAPNLPSEEEALARSREGTNAAGWAASEASAAASQARAAESAEAAAKAELAATAHALTTREQVHKSQKAAEAAIISTHNAEAAAKTSRNLVEEIPGAAMKGAKDAVEVVVKEAVKKMEGDARAAADEAAAILKAAQLRAAKMANEEAAPFVDAKIRAEKQGYEKLKSARIASESATELINEAMHVSGLAEAYQAANNPVVAQQMLAKATDLMDKGKQLEAYANNEEAEAGSTRGLGGAFSKAIKAASKWGAFEGNPAGKPPPLPPLPAPLQLPPR